MLFEDHMDNMGHEGVPALIQGSFLCDSYVHGAGRSLRRTFVYRTDRR